MKLKDLLCFNNIVIQTHDNPDADAVGSGFALCSYFKSHGKNVRLIYSGRDIISKSNMKLMISELNIPIEYVKELKSPELLLTVDCQYGQGNVTHFDADNIAMIDHHDTGRTSDEMSEIRSSLVSCATLCFSMLKDADFDVNSDTNVATALFYGLYMDSGQLSQASHPLDRDMIDFLHYDRTLINRLKYSNFSLNELDTAGYAISHNNYIAKNRFSIVHSKPCDPNILGVISDFVIQVDSIDICVVYNETTQGYKLSIRSCTPEAGANELAGFICSGIGNGGGHIDKAGGFISKYKFEQSYGTTDIEKYILDKFNEYLENYDVVRYTDEPTHKQALECYRKKASLYGYVKSTDIPSISGNIKVRTLEGDVLVTCRDDIYLMVGIRGEVYPIERSVFERKYSSTDEDFHRNYEYPPSIIDTADNQSTSLLPLVHSCRSKSDDMIYARPLLKFTKVFTSWNYETYMSGCKGDMLCYTAADSHDVYVVKKAIFDETYEPVNL